MTMADPIRAWEEGWLAHHGAAPESECPYPLDKANLRHGWLLGWRDARTVARHNQQAVSEETARPS